VTGTGKPRPRPAEAAAWTVEPDGIALLNARQGRHLRLGYPEAAVWDLLARQKPEESLLPLLEAIAGLARPQAEELLASCLASWLEEGWLEAGEPEARAPEAGAPEEGKLKTGEPEAGAPEAGEPEEGKLKAGEPEARAPEAGKPR
jgi:hypothetical protein